MELLYGIIGFAIGVFSVLYYQKCEKDYVEFMKNRRG